MTFGGVSGAIEAARRAAAEQRRREAAAAARAQSGRSRPSPPQRPQGVSQSTRRTAARAQTPAARVRRGVSSPASVPQRPQGVSPSTRRTAARAQAPAVRARRETLSAAQRVGDELQRTIAEINRARPQVRGMSADLSPLDQIVADSERAEQEGLTPEQRVGISGFDPAAIAEAARIGRGDGRSFGGFLKNLGRGGVDMVMGTPAALQLAGQTALHPLFAGLDQFAPGGGMAQNIGRGGREQIETDLSEAAQGVKADYAYRWGPLFQGNFGTFGGRFYDDPLPTILDTTAAASIAGRAPNVAARGIARATPQGSPINTRARNYTSILGPGDVHPLTGRPMDRPGNRHRPDRVVTDRAGPGPDAPTRTVRIPQRPYSANAMTRGVQKAATRVTRNRITPAANRAAERMRGQDGSTQPLRRQAAEGILRPFTDRARIARHDARETREITLRRKQAEAAAMATERQDYIRALRKLRKDRNEAGIETRSMNVDGLGMEHLATRLHLEGLLTKKPGVSLRDQLGIATSRMREGITRRKADGEDVRAEARQVERIAALPDDLVDLGSGTARAKRVAAAVEAGRKLNAKAQEMEVDSKVVSPKAAGERASLATRMLLGGSTPARGEVAARRAAGDTVGAARVREEAVGSDPRVQELRAAHADAVERYEQVSGRTPRKEAASRVAETRRAMQEYEANQRWRVAGARQDVGRAEAKVAKERRRLRNTTREAAAQAKLKAENRRKAAEAEVARAPTTRQALRTGERAGEAKAATRTAPGAKPGRDAPDIQGHPTTKRVEQERTALADARRSGNEDAIRRAEARVAAAEKANREAAEKLARDVGGRMIPERDALRASLAATRATYGVPDPSAGSLASARRAATAAGGEAKLIDRLAEMMKPLADSLREKVSKDVRTLGRDLRDQRVADAAKAAKPGVLNSRTRINSAVQHSSRDAAFLQSQARYKRNVHNPDLSERTGVRTGRGKYRRKNLDDHARDALAIIERGLEETPHLVSKAERDVLETARLADSLDHYVNIGGQSSRTIADRDPFGPLPKDEIAFAREQAPGLIADMAAVLKKAGVADPLTRAVGRSKVIRKPPPKAARSTPSTDAGRRRMERYFTPEDRPVSGRLSGIQREVSTSVDRAKRDAARRVERANKPTRTRAGVSPAKASAFGREFDARAAGRKLVQAEQAARSARNGYVNARAAEARTKAKPLTKAQESRLRAGLDKAEAELAAAVRELDSVRTEKPKALQAAHQRAREELARLRDARVGTPAKIAAATTNRRNLRAQLYKAETDALEGAITRPVRQELVGHDGVYIPHVRRRQRTLKSPFAGSRGFGGPKQPKRSVGILIGDGVIDWSPALLNHQAQRAASNAVGPMSRQALAELMEMAAFTSRNGEQIKGTRAVLLAKSDTDAVALVNIDGLQKALRELDDAKPGDYLSTQVVNDAVAAGRDLIMNIAETGPNSGRYIAISKAAADEWRGAMQTPGRVAQVWDSLHDWWKGNILALSPRWYVNSTFGVAMQYGLLSLGDIRSIRQANKQGPLRESVPLREALNTHAADVMSRRMQGGTMDLTRLRRAHQTGFNINNRLESGWRRAAYLNRGKSALRNEGVRVRGLSDEELARALTNLPESVQRQITRDIDLYLGEFRKFSPLEQSFLRRTIPFYSWLRVISKLSMQLPFRSPLRAEMLMVMSKASMAGINPEDYQRPYWDRGGLVFGNFRIRTMGPNSLATLVPFVNAIGEMGNSGGSLTPVMKEMGSWMTPMITTPVQVAAGQNTFFNDAFTPDGRWGVPKVNPLTGQVELTSKGIAPLDVVLNAAIPGQVGPFRRALAAGESVYDSTSTLELLKFRLGVSDKRYEDLFYKRTKDPVNTPVGPKGTGSAAGGFFGVPITRENARARERRYREDTRAAEQARRKAERESRRG